MAKLCPRCYRPYPHDEDDCIDNLCTARDTLLAAAQATVAQCPECYGTGQTVIRDGETDGEPCWLCTDLRQAITATTGES